MGNQLECNFILYRARLIMTDLDPSSTLGMPLYKEVARRMMNALSAAASTTTSASSSATTSWKDHGNALFQEKRFVEAIDAYTKGLLPQAGIVNTEKHVLYSNRAAAKLELGDNQGALQDAIERRMRMRATEKDLQKKRFHDRTN